MHEQYHFQLCFMQTVSYENKILRKINSCDFYDSGEQGTVEETSRPVLYSFNCIDNI